MKKEELLALASLMLLPGCLGSEKSCDVSCPPPCVTQEHSNECDIHTYIDAHEVEVAEKQNMQAVFDRELEKWEEELDKFTALSEMDEFEMKAWEDPEILTPLFMASGDDAMDQVTLQNAIEMTVEQYEKAKEEGAKLCVVCEEHSWSELDQASAQILADELIAAGIDREDIRVMARVAEYNQSLPAHRLEVKMVSA